MTHSSEPGERLPILTSNLTPPHPIDGPLDTNDYAWRLADMARAQTQFQLQWEANGAQQVSKKPATADYITHLLSTDVASVEASFLAESTHQKVS